MHKVPKAFLQAVATHRAKLEKVITAQASSKMKKLYDEATAQLMSKLRANVRGGKGDTFTVHQQRMALAQLKQGQAVLSKRMAGDMRPLSENAQKAALKGLIEDVTTLHKKFTGAEITLPVEEAATFNGVINGRASSLLTMHKNSMARYGTSVVNNVQKQMALSLLQGETPQLAIDRVEKVVGGEWWQAERIVRTEMAYAYNATHRDGIERSAEEIPELMMRWEEHCDDVGEPLDDRVGVDSIAMHGQVARPGGNFIMPATAPFADAKGRTEVPEPLVGLAWEFPPNRPNDRAVLSPWMADWGIPGWRYVNGRRVPVED